MYGKKVELISYYLPCIETHFDKIPNGSSTITLNSTANVLIPKNGSNCGIIIKMIIEFRCEDTNSTILHLEVDGVFNIEKTSDSEDVKDIIKSEASKMLYQIAKEKLDCIVELSNVEFLSLPEYSDVVQEKTSDAL